jgi:hypothetical protein
MQQVNKTFRWFQIAENRKTKNYGDLFVTEEVFRNMLKSYNYFSAFKSNMKHTCYRISVFTVIFTVRDGAVILFYRPDQVREEYCQ